MFDDLRERAAIEYEEPPPTNVLQRLLRGLSSQQRFALSLVLLLNVIVIGCMCLIVLGRIQF